MRRCRYLSAISESTLNKGRTFFCPYFLLLCFFCFSRLHSVFNVIFSSVLPLSPFLQPAGVWPSFLLHRKNFILFASFNNSNNSHTMSLYALQWTRVNWAFAALLWMICVALSSTHGADLALVSQLSYL